MPSGTSLKTAQSLAIMLLTTSAASAQTSDFKAQVVQSTAKALSDSPDSTGNSITGLRSAQADADRAYNCQSPSRVVILSDAVSNDVAERVRNDLLAGPDRSVVLQRPEYTAEIIATAVASFELGRIYSISEEEMASLCATTVAQ